MSWESVGSGITGNLSTIVLTVGAGVLYVVVRWRSLMRARLIRGVRPSRDGATVSADQRVSPRDRFLLIMALVGFGLWLASVGPVRTWATRAGERRDWAFEIAPSFLAAFTFVFWQAFATRSRPLVSALYGAALVSAAEVAQLFLPRYTADVWDVVAGIVGAAVAMPLLLWRESRRR